MTQRPTLLRRGLRKLKRLVVPPADEPSRRVAANGADAAAEARIDVRALIAERSIEELNRSAEEYFAGLSSWDYHLSKPFSTVPDAPALLINFAVVLQGLRLAPGLRVLDFGAGTGWTSRWMTQLGCEVILLDVSQSALEIAAEHYRRQPVVGVQPPPRFLLFDGRRIDLPDGSVDRILCFDAFHHAPNPDDVLREFGRILAPGGIAAFGEPGPEHSKTAQSQFEMRTYGVVENDIDVRAIWRTAREAGFADMKIAAYNIPPFHVSLDEYDDLLEGGTTARRWTKSTREFLNNVRNFFLYASGAAPLDSRQTEGLRAEIDITMPNEARAGEPIAVRAAVTNSGSASWLPSGPHAGGVSLGSHLYDGEGHLKSFDHHWENLTAPPRRVEPGERLELAFELPPLEEGDYMLEFDCVSERICWFAQAGSTTVRIPLRIVTPA